MLSRCFVVLVVSFFLSFVLFFTFISHSRFVYTETRTQTYTILVSIRLFDALVVVASQWLFDTLGSFVRSFVHSIYFLFASLAWLSFSAAWMCVPDVGLSMCVRVFFSLFLDTIVCLFFHFNSHQKRNHIHKLGFNQIAWFVHNFFCCCLMLFLSFGFPRQYRFFISFCKNLSNSSSCNVFRWNIYVYMIRVLLFVVSLSSMHHTPSHGFAVGGHDFALNRSLLILSLSLSLSFSLLF